MTKKAKNYFMIMMALIGIGAFYLIFHCPIKYLTGISCPGCGMTRAFISLAKLDFEKAFYYHPLWCVPIIFVFVYILFKNKHKKIYNAFICLSIVLFIIVYLHRLFSNNEVVNIQLERGLLYRIYLFVLK